MKHTSVLRLVAALCLSTFAIAPGPLAAALPSAFKGNVAAIAPLLQAVDNVNKALVTARQDNQDKKFADAETLMLEVTGAKPELIYPWLELGTAQLGLEKYKQAEKSFKIALGIDPGTQQKAHASDFYQNPDAPPGTVAPTATHASRNVAGGGVSVNQARTPEILGLGYSSLGEVYIRMKKVPEAKEAFDNAVKADPSQAALFRHNETVFFFQRHDAPNQLEAANQAIAADPARAANYYFKGQALVGQATIDPKTNKLVLPDGCAEAYQKYLELEPAGQFAADSKGVLTSAGVPLKGKK